MCQELSEFHEQRFILQNKVIPMHWYRFIFLCFSLNSISKLKSLTKE